MLTVHITCQNKTLKIIYVCDVISILRLLPQSTSTSITLYTYYLLPRAQSSFVAFNLERY